MQSGMIKAAIENVSEALRPAAAKQVGLDMLGHWYAYSANGDAWKLEFGAAYMDELIPAELIDAANTQVEQHGSGVVSLRLLVSADDDFEMAKKQGLEEIDQLVVGAYAANCTPEVRDQFVGQFETWLSYREAI